MRGTDGDGAEKTDGLIHPALRKPLLPATLGFALLGLFPHARLLVKPAPFKFAKEAFAGEFFLGDLQGLFNIVIEDLDFHRALLSVSATEVAAWGYTVTAQRRR